MISVRGEADVGGRTRQRIERLTFGGDPGMLGRTISPDGYPIPVVGVTPVSFFGVEVGNRYDVAIPLCADRLRPKARKAADKQRLQQFV